MSAMPDPISEARIILFRGMNTGGVRVPVSSQRAMALDLGLGDPRTLLASGNLIVDSPRDPEELERLIEDETERRFGRRIETLVCSGQRWRGLMAANPFPDEAKSDPAHLLMMVMKQGIRPGALEALQALAVGREKVAEAAGALWFWHPDGIGPSRMAEKAQPRLVGAGTGRNWNTVVKIADCARLGEDR